MFHVCINSVSSDVPLSIAALRGVPADTRFVSDEAVMLGDHRDILYNGAHL
jgi:hypothetical protein